MPPDADAMADYNFNDQTDISVVAWLAQYDPSDLPPVLGSAFRLGPIQSSLGITQPIVWLANLSCDFRKAYKNINDPQNILGPSFGGRRNAETGVRTYPREFSKGEQNRFDRLQDEYHNLRWRNLLNLGYDPATAATMVGAIKDAEQNLFSPPPLFALSPRMIVTDEAKRMSMKGVLIEYLNGKAEEAERQLLEDLDRESLLQEESNGNGKKGSKNARKKAKKKKKQQAAKLQQQQQEQKQDEQQHQQQEQQQTQSPQPQKQTIQQALQSEGQKPLNKEQLKYLREHQQCFKKAYNDDDRQIIEDALQRNGLTSSAATSPASAETIYKKEKGKTDAKEGEESGNQQGQQKQEGLKYDEEVQNYAYAWCCDYCKTATFPTFAEAALHEAQCEAYLELKRKNATEKEAGGAQTDDSENVDNNGDGGNIEGEEPEGREDEETEQTLSSSPGNDSADARKSASEKGSSKEDDDDRAAGEDGFDNPPPTVQQLLQRSYTYKDLEDIDDRFDAKGMKSIVDSINSEWEDSKERQNDVDRPNATDVDEMTYSADSDGADDVASSADDMPSNHVVSEGDDVSANDHRRSDEDSVSQSYHHLASKIAGEGTTDDAGVAAREPATALEYDEILQASREGEWTPVVAPSNKKKSDATDTDVAKSKMNKGNAASKNQQQKENANDQGDNTKQSTSRAAVSAVTSELGNVTQSKSASTNEKQTKKKKKKQKRGQDDPQKENIVSISNGKRRTSQAHSSSSTSSTDIASENIIASMSDEDKTLQMMKSLAIDYEDRVNDTALLPQQPTAGIELGQSTSDALPPVGGLKQPSEAASLPLPQASGPDISSSSTQLQLSSLTSENEILTAQNNFLIQQNKSLMAENEALKSRLMSEKQQSVEAVQRVQLKAYIAETARDVAEERVAHLENMLVNAVADMAAKEVVRQEVHEAVVVGTAAAAAYSSSMAQQQQQQQQRHQQQQQHHHNDAMRPSMTHPQPQQAMLQPRLPQASPGYHLHNQQSLQHSPAASPLISDNGMSLHSNNGLHPHSSPTLQRDSLLERQLLSSHQQHQSMIYPPDNQQHRHVGNVVGNHNSFTPAAPQDSMSSNDFWEPPWMIKGGQTTISGGGGPRESVLSRLRRGDHAS